MNAYFVSVFAICTCLGALGILSYNEKNGAERAALGIILFFVILSPIAESIDSFDFGKIDMDALVKDYCDSGYSEVSEAALVDGISRALSNEFSFSEDDIYVTLSEFDFETMRCDKINVLLSGRAVFSDIPSVVGFVEDMGIGECYVEIEIGG